MNWADYAILAVLGLSVLMGLWRGFVAEVLALAVWACAFWVAWLLGPALAERFSASISTPSARVILAYALCFIAVLIAGAIVTPAQRQLMPMFERMLATPMDDRKHSQWQFGNPVTFSDPHP